MVTTINVTATIVCWSDEGSPLNGLPNFSVSPGSHDGEQAA